MRKAEIYYKDEIAGFLTQLDDGTFEFHYSDFWMNNDSKPSISPTLPKNRQVFQSQDLFPFFFNMLPEGANKELICKTSQIDKSDDFGLLVTVARYDAIGAVRVNKIM